jgi:hypothetical protein
MKRKSQSVKNLYVGPGQDLCLRLKDPNQYRYFPVKFRIPKQYWKFDPRRFPWGSMTWKKEPGIGLPASPGVFDEEFVPQEHTQGTGPGISSHITNLEPYFEKGTVESKPSISREEF